jgi:hemolysin activation/secretion protein
MRIKTTSFCSLLSLAGLAIPAISHADLTPTQQQEVDKFQGQVDPTLTGRMMALPLAPVSAASVSVPGFTPQAATAAALHTTFVLNQLNIVGSSVYGNPQLANMFRQYIGRTVSLADLQKMADDITLKYRNDGYILTRAIVPVQNVREGVATIRVIEGYVAQVNISGNPKGARALLENYGDQIKRARPFNIKTLERYALLANDIPGMDVRAILGPARMPQDELAPAEITPGAAILTFVAAQSTAHGYLTFDNRGTKFLGPNEYSFGGNINSIFRAGDTTGVQALTTTNTKELRFIRLYHQTPLGDDGLMLNIASSYSRTEPGYILEPLALEGRSTTFSAGVTYPIIRSQAQSLYVNAGFDVLNSKTNVLTDTPGAEFTLYNDRLRSFRVGANYNDTDNWLGINQLGGQLSQGISALGATQNGSGDLSRPNGRTDYTKANFNAARLQGLGHNFSVYTATQGQYGFVPLLSAEQFNFGGAEFGEAYDPAEITGDRGIAGKVEVRYDAASNWKVLQAVQPFAFYDIGKIWNVDPISLPGSASAASAGFGVRANLTHFITGSLTWAKPLTRNVATENNKNARVFFSITLAGDTPSNTVAIPLPPPPAVQPAPLNSGLQFVKQEQVKPAAVPVAQSVAVQQPDKNIDDRSPLPPLNAGPQPKPQPAKINNATPPTPKQESQFEGLTEVSSSTVATTNKTDVNKNVRERSAHPDLQVANNTKQNVGQVVAQQLPDKNSYVLQLMSGRDLNSLKRFAAAHHLTDQVNFIHTQHNGGEWYILAYGHYDSAEQAVTARAQLPAALKELHPWIRKIK